MDEDAMRLLSVILIVLAAPQARGCISIYMADIVQRERTFACTISRPAWK